MSEDMTYEPVQTVAQLAARVQELEHQLAQADSNTVALAARNAELAARLAELEPSGFAMANSALIQRVHQLEAQLNAVPGYTYACLQAKERGEVSVWPPLDEWLEMGEPDGNGDDAPLTLADIDDEDGDL